MHMNPSREHIDGITGASEELTPEAAAKLDASLDDFLGSLETLTPKRSVEDEGLEEDEA